MGMSLHEPARILCAGEVDVYSRLPICTRVTRFARACVCVFIVYDHAPTAARLLSACALCAAA